jgi:hypothetical protein
MSTDFQKIREIASASLLPDFFAVRIEEEQLFDAFKEMVAKIKLPKPLPQLDRIRQVLAAAPDPNAFIEEIKRLNLWQMLRDILSKIKVQ